MREVAKLSEEKTIPVKRIGSMELGDIRYINTKSLRINTKRECFLYANSHVQTKKEFDEQKGRGNERKIRFAGEWLVVKLTETGLEVEMPGKGHEGYIGVDLGLSLETAASKGFLPVARITRVEK